jgi:hypothetical protein
MFRATHLLIALALAGGPATSLGCALWCTSPSGQEHHRVVRCYEMSNGPAVRPHVVATGSECLEVGSDIPFLTEPRSDAPNPLAGVAPLPSIVATESKRHQAPARAPVFNVPSSDGALHAILRV